MAGAALLQEAILETDQCGITPITNEPQMSRAFSHVCRVTGQMETMGMPDYYRIVDIEDGSIHRARELARGHQMRHCFNEDAIIGALEQCGEGFNIAKVQILSEEYLATA